MNKLPDNFPCPVCHKLWKIQKTYKGKPYYVCPPCMTQVFIRGQLGIERLTEYQKRPQLLKKLADKKIVDCSEILAAIEKVKIINFQLSQDHQSKLKQDRKKANLEKLKIKIENFIRRKLIPHKGGSRGKRK